MIIRYLKIIIPIILLILIIGFIWWITDPNRKVQIQQPTKKEVISQIQTPEINLNEYGIYNIIQIDEENYILVTRKLVLDEQMIPVNGIYENSYVLYKYNTKTGIGQSSINIDSFFQIAGVNVNAKVMYLATTDLQIHLGSVESPYNIVELNYETMKIQKTLTDKTNYYNCIISNSGNQWVYLVNHSLYCSNYNFENEKLLVDNSKQETDVTYIYPCDIANNHIIYIQYDSEFSDKSGIRIINSDGTNERIINAQMPIYIKYNLDTNEIYYTDQESTNQVFAVNLDTLVKKVLFEYTPEDKTINTIYYISPNAKNIVVVEENYTDGIGKIKMYIYELNSNELIAQKEIEGNGKISNVTFAKDKILFINSDKLYEWNYKIK